MSMMRYELKKVFSRTCNQIALFLLLAVIVIVCYFACNISFVNTRGETIHGTSAVRELKAEQKKWAGVLDEDAIARVIAENRRITSSPEYSSNSLTENEIAYGQGEGIREIRELLNASYAKGFRDYDYYRANELTEADAPLFYSNRISLLKTWLQGDEKERFSDAEKSYLIGQYESLQTPFYYDYMKGWSQLFEFAPTVVMITMLVLGFLAAGIFSGEFSWNADSIFFSSLHGRKKATAAKVQAGFCMVTVLYFAAMLLYTAIVLVYLGADGWSCPIQISQWKSFYTITIWQEYLLILMGGYLGCLFLSFLCMLASAKTRSAVFAVILPFLIIFIPSFVSNINSAAIDEILGLLPDQLLQIGTALNYFRLYSIGGKIMGEVPLLLLIYAAATILLVPSVYQLYRHQQIG